MADLDIVRDVAERMAALSPTDVVLTGAGRTMWGGREIESKEGGAIPLQALFLQLYGGRIDLTNDGAQRFLRLQLVVRGNRRDETSAAVRAERLFSAVNNTGAFTGASSGAAYQDIRAVVAAPYPLPIEDSDAEYFALDLEAWLIS
jgi:hypothetical protein